MAQGQAAPGLAHPDPVVVEQPGNEWAEIGSRVARRRRGAEQGHGKPQGRQTGYLSCHRICFPFALNLRLCLG